MQGHDLLAAGVGKRAEKHAPDDAEHRGVRADAQAEGERDHGGEARVAAKASRAVLEVLDEGLEKARAPGVAAFLLDTLDAAEAHGGTAPRLLRAQALALPLLGLELEMEAQLVVQLTLGAIAGEEGAQEMADTGERAHRIKPGAARA